MLTAIEIQRATCPPDKARARFADAGGLYLEVSNAGGKRWFWKYYHAGKEKRLALGTFPDVTLKQARFARDDARKLLSTGVDPVQQRKMGKAIARVSSANTYEAVAREYHALKEREPAWDFFGQDDKTVGRVLDRVRQAFEQALNEISRPSATNETSDLQDIIKKARDLQRAIKISSLPGNLVFHDRFELCAEDMPPIPIDLGWHSLRPEGYALGYPLAICDVLDWAVALAQNQLDNRPVRSLARQKDQPELTSFVRHLAWHFNREFQREHRTAIAHIATAVFNLANPLDVKGVDGRLKDRKRPFTTT